MTAPHSACGSLPGEGLTISRCPDLPGMPSQCHFQDGLIVLSDIALLKPSPTAVRRGHRSDTNTEGVKDGLAKALEHCFLLLLGAEA